MKHLVIIGAGFAGLRAAISAAGTRHELTAEESIQITLINKTPYHFIRVCNYQEDIESTKQHLADLLGPLDIHLCIGNATHINTVNKTVSISTEDGDKNIPYTKLILATGSQQHLPSIPGIKEYAFNIDQYHGAKLLNAHLAKLDFSEPKTIAIIGGGFTGIELATNLAERLPKSAKTLLIDRSHIAHTLGEKPQEYILERLQSSHITCLSNKTIAAVSEDSIRFTSGEKILTNLIIWTTGLRASPLTSLFKSPKQVVSRLYVNEYLQILNEEHCFAAGDVAYAQTDSEHFSLMSCQHAIPQGIIAGYNAIADLCQKPLIPYEQERYVTCLDLGSTDAIFTEGWEREIKKTGPEAKAIKKFINTMRIRISPSSSEAELYQQAKPSLPTLKVSSPT